MNFDQQNLHVIVIGPQHFIPNEIDENVSGQLEQFGNGTTKDNIELKIDTLESKWVTYELVRLDWIGGN